MSRFNEMSTLLFVILVCFFSLPIAAAPAEARWTINSWGGAAHSYSYNDISCGLREGKPSTSFMVRSRGIGDSELVIPGVLSQNDAYEVSVWLKADKAGKVRLFFRRDGAHYETAAIQTANVTTAWKQIKLKGIYPLNTLGSVRLGLDDVNLKVCINGAVFQEVDPSSVGNIASIPNIQQLAIVDTTPLNQGSETRPGLGGSVVGGGGGGTFSGIDKASSPIAPKPVSSAPATNKTTTTASTSQLPAYATKPIDNSFFGIHINKLGVHSTWPSFNPGSIRLWDTGTTWANLQPYKGPIQWSSSVYAKRLDMYVDYALRNNPDVQIIYTLGMTPDWAGSKHAKSCNNYPYGRSACTMPVNIDDWRNYVKALATRYKGRIKVWELWNEADYWAFWDGGAENMATLARVAYQELKAIDPTNKLIGPNVTNAGMSFLSQFLATGGGSYIDAISVHVYLGRSTDRSTSVLRNLRAMLDNHGLDNIALWNTEANVSCNPASDDCKPTIERGNTAAEDALAQGVISNAALKIANFSFYTWEGASLKDGGKPMVEANYSTPTALGRVYSIVKSWLLNSYVDYVQFDVNGLNQVRVEKNGKVALVLWTTKSNFNLDVTNQPTLTNFSYAGDNFEQKVSRGMVMVSQTPVIIYPDGFSR